MKKLIAITVLAASLLVACKKKEEVSTDTSAPQIFFHNVPSVVYNDTLPIKGKIEDNQGLQHVMISVKESKSDSVLFMFHHHVDSDHHNHMRASGINSNGAHDYHTMVNETSATIDTFYVALAFKGENLVLKIEAVDFSENHSHKMFDVLVNE